MGNSSSSLPPLKTVDNCNTTQFMGTWFVIGNMPTPVEHGISNAVEKYTRMPESKSYDVYVDFTYRKTEDPKSSLGSLPQKGYIQGDKENSGDWLVSPAWPLKFTYPIIELDSDDYQWVVIGFPNRKYAWIMAREPTMPEETYQMLTEKMVKDHQYDLKTLRRVPQNWSHAEREKRGLSPEELPDRFLNDGKDDGTQTTSE